MKSVQKTAIKALVAAYKKRHSEYELQNEEVLTRYVLQEVNNPHGAKNLSAILDDSPGFVQLKPSEIIELLQMSMQADALLVQLKNSQSEADGMIKLWNGAKQVLDGKRGGGNRKDRYADALYQLGLTGEQNGEGRTKNAHIEAAELYFLLRTGGHIVKNGKLQLIEARSHADAVQLVEQEFKTEWESLERAWSRIKQKTGKTIRPSYQAEVYPIK